MKDEITQDLEESELIATFGEAQLIKVHHKLELRRGSMADRLEALEWLSLFMPEEVPRLSK